MRKFRFVKAIPRHLKSMAEVGRQVFLLGSGRNCRGERFRVAISQSGIAAAQPVSSKSGWPVSAEVLSVSE
jgi:hypothetical protein